MARDFVRFQSNVPERLALATTGAVKDGLNGPRKLFHTADGRGLYLDVEIAQRVEQW